jgi:polysaccharide export outer membrane protein
MVMFFCATSLPVFSQTVVTPGPINSQNAQQVQPQPSIGAKEETIFSAANLTLIGPGDLIEITVYGAADFNKQVRVSDNGDVDLPLIGAVKLAGLSTHEGEALIRKRLMDGGFYNDPQVSIFEKEYASQGISVLGEVQKPGTYPLLGARFLFEALSAAGGTTPKAGKTVTIIHRGRPQQPETIALTYSGSTPQTGNVPVQPGDTIVVSKAGLVYVVGDVRQPSGILLDGPQLTVLQAVAMAQGANPTASLDHAKVIRKTQDGPKEIPVHLSKIMQAKAQDIELKDEDILFIPSSAAKSATRRGLEAILQTATGLAIYRR